MLSNNTRTAPKILGRVNRSEVIVQMPLNLFRYHFAAKQEIMDEEDDDDEIVFQGKFDDAMNFLRSSTRKKWN